MGGGHAGQMSRATGGGDEDLDAARFGSGDVLRGLLGRAMRGEDAALVRDIEARERLGRVAHGFPIAFAAHDDADEGSLSVGHGMFLPDFWGKVTTEEVPQSGTYRRSRARSWS